MSVRRELASGVFYTSIAKYAGIVVTLVVTGILSRLFTPEEFGVVNIATVVIAFFAIFSDWASARPSSSTKTSTGTTRRDFASVWSGGSHGAAVFRSSRQYRLSTAIRRCCATSCASSR